MANDPKDTKKSDARDLAGRWPDTPLLRRNEMVSLKLTPLRFAQTGEPKSLSFRPALLDERLGLGQGRGEKLKTTARFALLAAPCIRPSEALARVHLTYPCPR